MNRLENRRNLTLHLNKNGDERRKMSVQIEGGIFDDESSTPFPKGINFEQKKTMLQINENRATKSQIRDIIRDVREKQWQEESKMPISEELPLPSQAI